MPLSPRPLHTGEHPHPDETPSGFREWSSHVGDVAPASGQARPPQPLLPGIDLTHPLAKVAAVAFVGYTFGRLMHRRSRKAPPPPASVPGQPYRPGATEPYRVQPGRERSSVRFR